MIFEKVIEKICSQQKGIKDTAAYCVGEQLKDIVRTTPGAAELVFKDLNVEEMSIVECEKKIRARADEKHKKNGGSCAFVTPIEADGIIRNFYGIPEVESLPEPQTNSGLIDLDSFL